MPARQAGCALRRLRRGAQACGGRRRCRRRRLQGIRGASRDDALSPRQSTKGAQGGRAQEGSVRAAAVLAGSSAPSSSSVLFPSLSVLLPSSSSSSLSSSKSSSSISKKSPDLQNYYKNTTMAPETYSESRASSCSRIGVYICAALLASAWRHAHLGTGLHCSRTARMSERRPEGSVVGRSQAARGPLVALPVCRSVGGGQKSIGCSKHSRGNCNHTAFALQA